MAILRLTGRQIAARLASGNKAVTKRIDPADDLAPEVRGAAVLVPLFRQAGQWRLLFIRRAENADDYHSGQVAFPGGRLEPGEYNPTTTALREAEEEIGLAPEKVRILGRLNACHTVSNYLVTPVVAQIPWPVNLSPAPEEVERIFSMPLGWLAEPKNHRVEIRKLPGSERKLPVAYFRPYGGELLWGVSARITLDLVRSLGERRTTE